MATKFFKRTNLSDELAEKLLSKETGSSSSSGVFLAAPRRTGKSTFLREDLRPSLEKKGALVIYADLWEDRAADPGDVIVNAIRATLATHDGVVTRLARAAGMEKVNVGGMSFSLDKVGLGEGVSLKTALAELSDEEKRPIVLIIDEAQHAITTEKGADALFALKAARDELNSSLHNGLRVVATGSNRDKLAMLRNSKDQAFFGAPLINFPPLGRDYIEWFCSNVDLPGKLSVDMVYELFQKASYRPEILGSATDTIRYELGLQPDQTQSRFEDAVNEQIEESNQEAMRVLHSLTPLQSAVLRVMATHGKNYAPFEATTIKEYQRVVDGLLAGDNALKVEVSNVQQALLALQEKTLVWKAARGVYALEDDNLKELMTRAGMLPERDNPGES